MESLPGEPAVPYDASFYPQYAQEIPAKQDHPQLRVAVTGVGAISPLGLTAEETWQRLLSGESGIRRIKSFDPSDLSVQIAGEVRGFSPHEWISGKTARQMAKFSQYAVAAAGMALADARLNSTRVDPDRAGVVLGTGACGIATVLETQEIARRRGLMHISPFSMIAV